MPISHGFSAKMGVGEESALGTPVAVTQLVCFLEESLDETINENQDNSLCGTAARTLGQPGTKIIEGGFSYPMRAGTGDLVLKSFFGDIEADEPSMGQDTYTLLNNIDGVGLTVAIDKQVSVWEFAGYKTSSLTISGNPADGIVVASEGFGVSLNLDSVTNTSMVIDALDEQGALLLFQDATFRIGVLGAALDSGDEMAISEFSIELNRNLEPVEVNSRNRTEALENGFRESTFTFTIPQYASDFFIDAHRAHTKLQADITIVSGMNTKTIRMPKLIVTDYSANISGPEFVTHEITCQIVPDPEEDNEDMVLFNQDSEIEIVEE